MILIQNSLIFLCVSQSVNLSTNTVTEGVHFDHNFTGLYNDKIHSTYIRSKQVTHDTDL
jgi:hypothetical protein